MPETDEHPPGIDSVSDAFDRAIERTHSIEDARWLVWLLDALEEHDWSTARWRGTVLHEKGYGDVINAVDREYSYWLEAKDAE